MNFKSSLLYAVAGLCLAGTDAKSSTVLTETFSYADGSLVGATGSPWVTHSGTTPGQVDVASSMINLTSSETEDVSAELSGSPYTVGVLTAMFDVVFTALPTAAGSYIAHFKDSTSGYRSRLVANATGAVSGTYRLGISNAGGSTATTVNVATDLNLNTTYTITMTWDLVSLASTLAINGGSSVAATDTTGNTAISVTSFAFRQNTGIGTSKVDNLTVTYVPEPATAILGALGALGILRRRR